MGSDTPQSILLRNSPSPAQRFNPDTVGSGRQYQNQALAGDRCVIRISAGIPWGETPLLFEKTVDVDCHINTDIEATIFQGAVAASLAMRATFPFVSRIETPFGGYAGLWSKQSLWLNLGVGYMPVEVWFPVVSGRNGWEWRLDFPKWNVLGMSNILNRRMLCVTAEEVYAFERT